MRARAASVPLLVLGVALGVETAVRLARLGYVPEKVGPYFLALFGALTLAAAAGRWSRKARGREAPSRETAAGSKWLRAAAAALSLGSFFWTWWLHERPEIPLSTVAVWLVGVLAIPFAFATVRPEGPGRRRVPVGFALGLLGLLALGAAARLAGLDRVHAVWEGDESTVTMDGRDLLVRRDRGDPFGTGSLATPRLAMMPAGAGLLVGGDPLGGPRFPYALVGTLALVVAALLAAEIGGGWAALACLALIALAPHHVHWSRVAEVAVLDSLIVPAGAAALLWCWKSRSPRAGCMAGIAAGLALYSYGGGKILPVALVIFGPFLLVRVGRGRRLSLGAALLAGFLVTAAPNLRFAARHFPEWNGRFAATSILSGNWFRNETELLGSPGRVIQNQIRLGTIGLLSSPARIHFQGHPMIGPPILVALGIAGFGWLLGRGRLVEALLLGLVVGGNLAGTAFTLSTPQPQRPSSLIPALAVLGGVAIAGLLSLLPDSGAGRARWRLLLGVAILGAVVVSQLPGYPLDPAPYAEGGGRHAAFSQNAGKLLRTPFGSRYPVFLHGDPYLWSTFPSFAYFAPDTSLVDVLDPVRRTRGTAAFPPGLHLVSAEYRLEAPHWLEQLGLKRWIRFAHPAIPTEDVGIAFVVPGASASDCMARRLPWQDLPDEKPLGLQTQSIQWRGRPAEVTHSTFDMGELASVLDADPASLVRTARANPAVFEFRFPEPRRIRGVEVTTGTMNNCLRWERTLSDGSRQSGWRLFRDLPSDPTVALTLPDSGRPVSALRVEIGNPDGGDGHIHIRTVRLF